MVDSGAVSEAFFPSKGSRRALEAFSAKAWSEGGLEFEGASRASCEVEFAEMGTFRAVSWVVSSEGAAGARFEGSVPSRAS